MTTPETLRLSDVASSVLAGRRQVGALALVGGSLGLVVALLIPSGYASTATVAVEPVSTSASSDADPAVDMATEAGAALTRPVAYAAARRLDDGTTAGAVGRRTVVANPEGSRLLTFTSTAPTPAQARRIADAVAQSYLQLRRDTAAQQVEELSSVIDDEISALSRKPSTIGRDATARELGSHRARLLAGPVVPGQVVTRAGRPAERVAPGPVALGVGGSALGLVLGAGLVVVRRDH